jgi:hypothetical protein
VVLLSFSLWFKKMSRKEGVRRRRSDRGPSADAKMKKRCQSAQNLVFLRETYV